MLEFELENNFPNSNILKKPTKLFNNFGNLFYSRNG